MCLAWISLFPFNLYKVTWLQGHRINYIYKTWVFFFLLALTFIKRANNKHNPEHRNIQQLLFSVYHIDSSSITIILIISAFFKHFVQRWSTETDTGPLKVKIVTTATVSSFFFQLQIRLVPFNLWIHVYHPGKTNIHLSSLSPSVAHQTPAEIFFFLLSFNLFFKRVLPDIL